MTPSPAPLPTIHGQTGTETIDLVPLLACVRFRSEVITRIRIDVRRARLLVSPLDPLAPDSRSCYQPQTGSLNPDREPKDCQRGGQ